MKIASKKIIKVRPGHLANFSGGAGYMPFIIFFSVPFSFLCTIIANIFVIFAARRSVKEISDTVPGLPRVELAMLLRFIRTPLIVSFIITVAASCFFFFMAVGLIYDSPEQYMRSAVILSIGPMISFLVSNIFLVWLLIKTGISRWRLLWSYLLYFVLTGIFIVVGWSFL